MVLVKVEHTVMYQLEAPYLIEVSPNGSAYYHKIVAPLQNRSDECI